MNLSTILKQFVERLRKSIHFHKFTTLLIYSPRKELGEKHYGFLMRCDCGKTVLTKLHYTIKEFLVVR